MTATTGNQKENEQLEAGDFTADPRVRECVRRLQEQFAGDTLVVSDVLDEHGNQYVNLVQKGGGVLGVALVGYTYILEQMGIRFLKLAGTSAGAINTALVAVTGKKEEANSMKVLDIVCRLDFFKLVDGHPVARWVIRKFITNKDFSVKAKKWLTTIILLLGVLFLCDFIFLGLQNKVSWVSYLTRISFVLTGLYLLLLGIATTYISMLFKRLKESGFGINPGDYLYDWIKLQLGSNGVHTVSDLNEKAAAPVPGARLRVPHEQGTDGLTGSVSFIASELVTQNKIQFPEMCYLFRPPGDINSLQPAGFIRASMSIPVFFESYFINDIPCTRQEIREAWLDKFNEPDPPQSARFVDGGILSNFPISLFYNPDIKVPRLPTFGIDLDDSLPEDNTKHAASWTLFGYFGRMFNTIRDYYDKDFLLKHKMFEKGIGKVHLSEFNWLNFFLTPQQKIDMFVKGAQAATEFLLKFSWDDYKDTRVVLHEQLQSSKSA